MWVVLVYLGNGYGAAIRRLPHLPYLCSQVALPMIVGGRVSIDMVSPAPTYLFPPLQ